MLDPVTLRSDKHACTDNLEDLEGHVPAHSSEREISGSEGDASNVETQKTESTVFILTSPKTNIAAYA